MERDRDWRRWALTASLAYLLAVPALVPSAHATTAPSDLADLSRMSIEELADIQVTSVSKRAEPIATAPASIYVIGQDEIRHSGATALPEALRLAPNLEVGRGDGSQYAISARGFQSTFVSNKLLVLIDGRSVYSPLHSGVYWDERMVMLDDVARIEVISGPGGTLWGANAVNGVINIVTRDAYDTQGGLLDLRYGADEKNVQARYGARVGDAAVRVYGMSFERGPSYLLKDGPSAKDGWAAAQGGFRADWRGQNDALTFSGDGYRTRIESDLGRTWGANVLARWNRRLGGDAGTIELQAYYDSTTRSALMTLDSVRVADVQAQHAFDLGRQRIIWGGGYRQISDRFINNLNSFVLVPQQRTFGLGNVFVEDEIRVTDALRLTGGVKIEHSGLTGTDYMPSVRLAWRSDDRSLVWAAVSRAVRTQSRIDKDLVSPGLFGGGPDFKTEKLVAYELGYRSRPFDRLSFSATAFYHDYDDIRTTSLVSRGPAPIVFLNGLAGKTYGIESWATFDVSDQLRLRAGLTVQQLRFALEPGANDIVNLQSLGDDPKHQASLRAEWRPREDVDVDLNLREVGALHRYRVPAYAEADLRVAWRPVADVELSLTGQNLLHDRHAETVTQTTSREIGRTVTAGLRWSF